MLAPDQVIPFLTHESPLLRDHAASCLEKANPCGELRADHYWEAIDRFGLDEAGSMVWRLADAPQSDNSVRRLIAALRNGPGPDHDHHLQQRAGRIELELLRVHRDELVGCAALLSHVREHLEQRLALAEQPAEPLWERLMEFGREVADRCVGEFDQRIADRYIEAMARQPEAFVDRALAVLDDPAAAEDWREIFAVQFLGAIRCERAVDPLIAKLLIDADALRERAADALARIGTVEVVEKLATFIPDKAWDVRLFADDPLEHIKRPQSESALFALLEKEAQDDLRGHLLQGLCALPSLAGLDAARQWLSAGPKNDPERIGLAESLFATVMMTGAEASGVPELEDWRRIAERSHARGRQAVREMRQDSFFSRVRENWRRNGISFDPASEKSSDEPAWRSPVPPVPPVEHIWPAPEAALRDAVTEPYRRQGPKVGRNDSCPCGSGKKYKKCCGSAAASGSPA